MNESDIKKSESFWLFHGFEVINHREWHVPLALTAGMTGSSSQFGFYYFPSLYEPNEVNRINFDISLSDEVKFIFNDFHLKKPIEEWENYNEICSEIKKIGEVFND